MFVVYLVLGFCSLASAQKTAWVFPILGQSNAVGYNTDGLTSEDVSYPNILQTFCCNDGSLDNSECQLVVAQDPLAHNCTSDYLGSQNVGFAMSFARSFREDIGQDDLIVLVPCGIPSTGFVDGSWTAFTGPLFIAAQQRIQKTFELLAKDYPSHIADLTGLFWVQGELDADAGTTASNYLNDGLIPLICALRNSSVIAQTNPSVPFVCGNMQPSFALDPDHPERLGVYTALSIVPQYMPRTANAPTQGLEADQSGGPAGADMSAASLRELGRRFYAALYLARAN